MTDNKRQELTTDVCIIGGGPAGILLAYILAKHDINVVVVEKSATYARDFRGEFIAGGAVRILDRLGLLEPLKAHGYLVIGEMLLYEHEKLLLSINFDRQQFPFKFGIEMPQPVFLETVKTEAQKSPYFTCLQPGTCESLIRDGQTVTGVICHTPEVTWDIHSAIVVGADGRQSHVRKLSGLEHKTMPFARDLIWFKVPRPSDWPMVMQLKMHEDKHIVLLPTYPDLLRVGINIPKHGGREARANGIEWLRKEIAILEPRLTEMVTEHVTSWKHTMLLDIFTADVPAWSIDGLCLIGDAAHTLSPVLGQGINTAMQDAYELGPLLAQTIKKYPGQPVRRNSLVAFERHRKRHIHFVRRFQTMQEKMLASGNSIGGKWRRGRVRLLNRFDTVKMALMQRLVYPSLPARF